MFMFAILDCLSSFIHCLGVWSMVNICDKHGWQAISLSLKLIFPVINCLIQKFLCVQIVFLLYLYTFVLCSDWLTYKQDIGFL